MGARSPLARSTAAGPLERIGHLVHRSGAPGVGSRGGLSGSHGGRRHVFKPEDFRKGLGLGGSAQGKKGEGGRQAGKCVSKWPHSGGGGGGEGGEIGMRS